MVPFLGNHTDFFPHPLTADEQGLVAFGTALTPNQLLLAYQFGIFPWYNPEDPVVWYFTHPRFVLFPKKFHIKKSLKRLCAKTHYEVKLDVAFDQIINACQQVKRDGQSGTWITDALKDAFVDLFEQGIAHCVGVWDNEELIGGLYGLSLGKVFYGESMFSKKSNASQIAFVHLVKFLEAQGYWIIDCQQETPHLKQFGAELISKKSFYDILKKNIFNKINPVSWKEMP